MGLLHIFDSSDSEIAEHSKKRSSECRLPIPKVDDLKPQLDDLFHNRKVFDRILFETHGHPGKILFNHKPIDTNYWLAMPRRYEFLTAPSARIYFNGCDVGEGEMGWRFLEAVAGVFLTNGDGEVFAHDTQGHTLPFVDHVFHIGGNLKTIRVKGGVIVERIEK